MKQRESTQPSARRRQALLPPYSPDLTAIEQLFAKLKHLIITL
jgi:transposase